MRDICRPTVRRSARDRFRVAGDDFADFVRGDDGDVAGDRPLESGGSRTPRQPVGDGLAGEVLREEATDEGVAGPDRV
jgi:hypothetical protein